MNYTKILKKVQKNKMDPKRAFEKLYCQEIDLPRSYFVKMRINILDSPLATNLVNVLFFIPVPIFVINFFLGLKKDEIGNDNYQLVKEAICYAKGSYITIVSDDVNLSIKVI